MLKKLISPEISWVSKLVLEKSILNEESRPAYENFRGDPKWFDKDFLLWKFTKTSIQTKISPPDEVRNFHHFKIKIFINFIFAQEFLRDLGPFYSAIITSAFNTDIWYNKTGFIAKKLPSTRTTIKKLLGIMCHPFMPKLEAVLTDVKAREGLIFELLTWILKIQIVTAMILVQLEFDPKAENNNNSISNTLHGEAQMNVDSTSYNSVDKDKMIDSEENISINGNQQPVIIEESEEVIEPPKKKRKITKVVKEAEITTSREWDELKMKLFHTLLMGPVDWSVIAAIVGLTRYVDLIIVPATIRESIIATKIQIFS